MARAWVLAAAMAMAALTGGCGESGGVTRASSSEFCSLTKTYQERISGLSARITDVSQLKPYLQELSKAVGQAVAVAPADIKADVKLLADTANDYVASFDKAGYDYTKVSPETTAKLASPDIQAAAARLSAYDKNVCGFTS